LLLSLLTLDTLNEWVENNEMKKLSGRCMFLKTLFAVLIAAIFVLMAGSCDKTEEVTNKAPTCAITSPKNDDELLQGETIDILVEAVDADGKVKEVIFKIDDRVVGNSNSLPYQYRWNTNEANAGRHNIKAMAIDDDNGAASQGIDILIVEEGSGVLETGTVDDYDGSIYKTVKIGTQWWMAENLKTTHFSDGTGIPLIESNAAWENLDFADKAYCYYGDSAGSAKTYGALYTWAAAMNGAKSSELIPSYVQGVCPSGWHLPSDGEWIVLEMKLGMSYEEAWLCGWRGTNEGAKMKAKEGWDNNGNGTNSSGFSALPAGFRSDYGLFGDVGKSTHFWSSTEYINNTTYAFNRLLSFDHSGVGWFHASHYYGYPKDFGFSVRCVKD
jgi:uncharacterized protein (TIGR02145 family)